MSGDPLRGSEYCRATNLGPVVNDGDSHDGRFVIDLGENGLPLADDDVTAAIDNCNDEYNPLQADSDNDDQGDVCDVDVDDDDRFNAVDNCLLESNPLQEDADGDGEGEACDVTASDTDDDGWYYPWPSLPQLADNCPRTPNPLQWNFDGEGGGDACDWEGSLFQFILDHQFPFTLKRGAATGFTDAEVEAMINAMMDVSPMKEEHLHWMLAEVFEQWKETKTTFIEFVVWAAEKQYYLGKKYE